MRLLCARGESARMGWAGLLVLGLVLILCGAPPAAAVTLKAVYEAAPAANGYDRYLELEAGRTYTGGLMVGRIFSPVTSTFVMQEQGLDVCIVGNGAVIDLQGEQICMSYCENRLDVFDCVLVNGGVRYRGDNDPGLALQPSGTVRYVTFYQPHDYAVRLQGAGEGVTIERNLIIDTIDTGLDYVPSSGITGPLLPTGTAIAMSVQTGSYGLPVVKDNWTYFGNPALNVEALHHFSFL
jgi:hypothetical protein